jgi:hypothetical protein
MPDARGNFKGQGWSKGREEGWERVFGAEMRAHDHDWDCTHAKAYLDERYVWVCSRCGVDCG